MAPEEQSPEEYKKSILDSLDIATELASYVVEIQKSSIEINKVFGQGRQRVSELMSSIADAVPMVNRLGGSMADVSKTISEVAAASNRNVIASTKDVEKLYAAQKVLGISAGDLTNAFLDVGIGLNKLPEQLEESIGYVQSIGGNAQAVMQKVNDNMEQMNRYQFEGGVVGLTKMAAQASMLRFNMNETFRLADKVLDPENAIEVASAFQRLGVSAGALADPFQLMNMSINDPSGLQDSLADVAKQFTYFDEKTKTFKINPQGVLTLREMEKQTGVSAAEMSKMGLAAAELDKRLSAVNLAGLTIGTEEDKQFLANIAKMGEGGEYEVKVKNEDGKEETKKLSEITQQEFDKLIQEQKEGPKSLEDMARVQMNISETIKGDVAAIKNAFIGGTATAKPVKDTIVAAQRTTDVLGGEASKKFGKTESVREEVETTLKDLGTMAMDFKEGIKPATETLSDYLMKVGNQMESVQNKFTEALKEYGRNVYDKMSDKTMGEKFLKEEVIGTALEKSGAGIPSKTAPIGSNTSKIENEKTIPKNQNITTKSTVDVGGKIEVDVKVPAGLSTEQLKQILDTTFNETRFKDYIVRLIPGDSKEPVSKTY
jgi:hypothetical protein